MKQDVILERPSKNGASFNLLIQQVEPGLSEKVVGSSLLVML